MKKAIILILVLLMCVPAFAGCSGGNDAPSPENTEKPVQSGDVTPDGQKPSDEVNIATYAYYVDPVLQLDPANTIANEINVINLMYETLLRYKPDTGAYEPLLAESYSRSDDNLSWTFVLRQGVKFHDGSEMTAEDVKYSIDRIVKKNQGQAYIWANVSEIVVLDAYTVRFDLTQPCPMEAIVSTSKGAHIYSKAAVEAGGDAFFSDGNDCGTGPYKLAAITWGTECVVEKFDEYWGGWDDNPNPYDMIVTKLVSEPSNRRQMIEAGEATVTHMLTKEDLDALETNPNVQVVAEKSVKSAYITLSIEKKALQDVNVRKALAYAFPYEKAIEFSMKSGIQSYGPIAQGILGYSQNLFQYAYDLDKAKQLLTEAGVAEGSLNLILTYQSGDETLRTMSELYQSELAKIGVTLELRPMTWSQMTTMIGAENPEDRQDMLFSYSMPALFNGYISMRYYLEGEASNYARYANAEVTRIVRDAYAMSGVDTAQAQELFEQAASIVIEDCVSIWVANINDVWVTSSAVGGFIPNPAYNSCIFPHDMYVK